MKATRLLAALATCLPLLPMPAVAHKVIVSVYPSGAQIEGEIGFSNGEMAKNAAVVVTGPGGRALGTTITDDQGAFTFQPTEAVEHVFKVNLGAGHVAEKTMIAADLATILGQPAVGAVATVPRVSASGTVSASPQTIAGLGPEAIAAIMRDEMRPLRQEIAAYKEKNDLQTILGGIGYIVGLFGIAFYVSARRRLAAG